MSLSFITSNPAISSFQEGMKFQNQQELDELRLREARRTSEEADALSSSRVQAQQAQNARTVLESNEAAATSGNRIRASAAGATSAETSAAKGSYDFQEQQDRRGLRDVQASTAARSAEVQADTDEAAGFLKSMELIEQGNTAGAQEIARRFNFTIPDAVLNNRQMAASMNAAGKEAVRLYPTNPKAQNAYMSDKAAKIMQDPAYAEKPGNVNDVTGLEPPSTTGATGATRNDFQIKVQAFKSIGYSDTDAVEAAAGRKKPTDAEQIEVARKMTATMFQGDFNPNPQKRQKYFDDTLQALRNGTFSQPAAAPTGNGSIVPGNGNGDATAAPKSSGWGLGSLFGSSEPAAPAAPAQAAPVAPPAAQSPAGKPQKPQELQGGGMEADPFQIRTQADIDWIRNDPSVPAGTVFVLPLKPGDDPNKPRKKFVK